MESSIVSRRCTYYPFIFSPTRENFSQILLGFKEEIYSSKTGEADVIPLQTKIKSLILSIIYCIQTPILQGRAERVFSKISVYGDRILFRFGLHVHKSAYDNSERHCGQFSGSSASRPQGNLRKHPCKEEVQRVT